MAMDRPPCACWWRGNRGTWILFCAMRFTESDARLCGTPSNTLTPRKSRQKLLMGENSSRCVFGTTEMESIRGCSKRASALDTGACQGCGNAPMDLADSYTYGAKPEQARRSK